MSERNRVERWLNQALELEHRGHDFYALNARAASDPQARDFFQFLADQELIHIKVIKKIYDRLDQASCWEDGSGPDSGPPVKSALNKLFLKITNNKPSSDEGLMKAIDDGIAFETEVRDLYAEQAGQAGCEGEREFLRLMIGEENLHRQTLADLKLFYSDPEGWAEQMDHGHLDGA